MNNEEFEILAAQVHALSMVVSALIGGLPPLAAAEAAVSLAIAKAEESREDANGETSALTSRTREGVLDAYLGLLSARTKSGLMEATPS